MTKSQRLEELRQKREKARSAIIEFRKLSDPTEEQRSAFAKDDAFLLSSGNDYERLQAEAQTEAQISIGADEAFSRLLKRSHPRNFVRAVAENRKLEGAEKEIADETGMPNGCFPVDFLMETRADATHSLPANTGETARMPLAFVHPRRAIIPDFQIPEPVVDARVQLYPVVTAVPTASTVARTAEIDATAGTIAPATLSPKRTGCVVHYQMEDLAVYPELRSATEPEARMALSIERNKQVLEGGTYDGFLTAGGGIAAADDPGADITVKSLIEEIAGNIDGRYARSADSIRLRLGVESYRKLFALRNTNDDSVTAMDELVKLVGMDNIRVDTEFAAPTGNNKIQEYLVRRGNHGGCVAPLWRQVETIVDRLTGANAGTLKVHFSLLGNFKILRTDEFKRGKLRLGA